MNDDQPADELATDQLDALAGGGTPLPATVLMESSNSYSQFESELSNVLKSDSDTSSTIVNNLKG